MFSAPSTRTRKNSRSPHSSRNRVAMSGSSQMAYSVPATIAKPSAKMIWPAFQCRVSCRNHSTAGRQNDAHHVREIVGRQNAALFGSAGLILQERVQRNGEQTARESDRGQPHQCPRITSVTPSAMENTPIKPQPTGTSPSSM